MNLDYFSDMFSQRDLSAQLHDTPWWQTLMANEQFSAALQQNYHMRLMLSRSSYLKKLLRSEADRQAFIHDVLNPAPEHRTAPEDDE